MISLGDAGMLVFGRPIHYDPTQHGGALCGEQEPLYLTANKELVNCVECLLEQQDGLLAVFASCAICSLECLAPLEDVRRGERIVCQSCAREERSNGS